MRVGIAEQALWTACVTPFDSMGDAVDFSSLERCLRLQEAAGNGIVVLGSTGEALSLTDSERRDVVSFACGLQLKSKIIVGVPSYNLSVALEWLDFCNNLPISGYLVSTPIYTKPGVFGQTQWFEAILNRSAHEVMLYNIPGRAGVKLQVDAVRNLRCHARFAAIKDSGGSVDGAREYRHAAPDIALFCGDDGMMSEFAGAGAAGLVSVASNAWPVVVRNYVERALRADKLNDDVWQGATSALFVASNPIPVKALMKDLNLIEYDTVRLPLSMQDLPLRHELAEWSKRLNASSYLYSS